MRPYPRCQTLRENHIADHHTVLSEDHEGNAYRDCLCRQCILLVEIHSHMSKLQTTYVCAPTGGARPYEGRPKAGVGGLEIPEISHQSVVDDGAAVVCRLPTYHGCVVLILKRHNISGKAISLTHWTTPHLCHKFTSTYLVLDVVVTS